jgi:hypothetical protein
MTSILRKNICLFKFSSTPPALQWLSADSTMDVTMDIGIGCLRHLYLSGIKEVAVLIMVVTVDLVRSGMELDFLWRLKALRHQNLHIMNWRENYTCQKLIELSFY